MLDKRNIMRAIELFSGIGGFRIALDELGFETVFANDIDEKASFVYKNNFGTEAFIQGDINHYKNLIPSHNILTAGFPCQPFSSAGKKKGVADPRGTLFESIVNILNFELRQKQLDPVIILGSQFPEDQDDYSYNILNRIMVGSENYCYYLN